MLIYTTTIVKICKEVAVLSKFCVLHFARAQDLCFFERQGFDQVSCQVLVKMHGHFDDVFEPKPVEDFSLGAKATGRVSQCASAFRRAQTFQSGRSELTMFLEPGVWNCCEASLEGSR